MCKDTSDNIALVLLVGEVGKIYEKSEIVRHGRVIASLISGLTF